MKSIFILLFGSVVLLHSLCEAEEGYFTVISSKLMRSNKPYRVSIHHEKYTTSKTLEIGIKGENFSDKKQVQLLNDGDTEVIFNVSY